MPGGAINRPMSWLKGLFDKRDAISGIDHVAIVVSDMDRAVEFYTGVLGLKLVSDGRTRGGDRKTFIGSSGRVLIALTEDKSRRKEASAPEACPVNHIAFRVPDLERLSGKLRESGVRFVEEKVSPDGKTKAYHFLDPDGLELEICGDTAGEVPQY